MLRARVLAGRARRRLEGLRDAREEGRFHSRLRGEEGAPELLLSPHMDDAVLDCWGLLAGERDLVVVNVFAGAPARGTLAQWDALTGATDSAQRVRERIAEDTAALAQAGRRAHNLGFLDAQYRAEELAPRLREIDHAVGGLLAAAARVHVPAGIGAHPDHLLTRRYGRMLLRAGIPVRLYAELPYCVRHGWPHWVDGRPAEPHRDVDAFWRSALAGVPELPPLRSATVGRLADAPAAGKLAAMRCYRSQLPGLEYGARHVLADPEIHRFEVGWELIAGDRAR